MINLRQSFRSNLLGLDPPRKLRDRSKRYRCIVLRQRRFVSRASYQHCGRRPRMDTQRRISHSGRSLIISRNELAWTNVTLVDRGHRLPLVAWDLGLVHSRQRSLHQLLLLGKGSDRHLRANGRRCAISRWGPGGRLLRSRHLPNPLKAQIQPLPFPSRKPLLPPCLFHSLDSRAESDQTLALGKLVLLWCYWSPISLLLLATDCEDRKFTKGP